MSSPAVEELIANLRAPIHPAHGPYITYANVQNALAALIEQNEAILEQLRLLNGPVSRSPRA